MVSGPIRSAQYGTYFGGSEDKLICNEKAPRASEWWTVHLAVHPQVNLKNVNRKKYARFVPGDDEKDTADTIQVKDIIPWGEEAIITLEFAEGKYALKSCNNMYLDREGYLVEDRDENCVYTLQIRSGQYSGMALKDCEGRFLTGVGMNATMQGRNTTVGKDELFTIEDSHPQVFFVAHNSKKVSIKQGKMANILHFPGHNSDCYTPTQYIGKFTFMLVPFRVSMFPTQHLNS